MGEQIEVCITDTGNAEDEVRLFGTEVNAVRVLQHDNAGFLDGGFLFARAVRDGNAHAPIFGMTMPLTLAYPSVTVNPALLEPDRALLRDAVECLTGTARTDTSEEPSAEPKTEDGLRYTCRLTRSMVTHHNAKPVPSAAPAARAARSLCGSSQKRKHEFVEITA